MSFSAFLQGEVRHSFLMGESEWEDLKLNYQNMVLKMICCNEQGIPKNSKLGTPFFSHKVDSECTKQYISETVEEQHIRFLLAKILTAANWIVSFEACEIGGYPSISLYAQKEGTRICVKTHWKKIPTTKLIEHTDELKEAGIKVVWFLKDGKDTLQKQDLDIPIFRLSKQKTGSTNTGGMIQINGISTLMIDTDGYPTNETIDIDAEVFFKDFFVNKNIHYSLNPKRYLQIYGDSQQCQNCQQNTNLIRRVDIVKAVCGEYKPLYSKKPFELTKGWLSLINKNEVRQKCQYGKLALTSSEADPDLMESCFYCGSTMDSALSEHSAAPHLLTFDTLIIDSNIKKLEKGFWFTQSK